MISSIIFSKDRPLQLDLCLNSVHQNFPDSTRNVVIYSCSPKFENAYKKLQQMHPSVEWCRQSSSIFVDTLAAIGSSPHDYVGFFTDDDIVYAAAPKVDNNLFGNPAVSCVSLRMGVNINKRRMLGQWQADIPTVLMEASNDCICWDKSMYLYGSYWAYSLSLDGHIFRKSDLHNMMDELCLLEGKYKWIQNPNQLEQALQRFWPITEPLIVAPEQSVVVNSPNNRVSSSHENNASGEYFTFCEEDFLEGFSDGKKINLELLEFGDISCPHTEIDLARGIM